MDPKESQSGQPEKYIRTFAGDIETVQKGGVPDLTPLTPHAEDKKTSQPPLPAEKSVEPPPTPKPDPSLPPLKTYSSDFSDRVKETHASPATVLAAEQDASPVVVEAHTEKHTLRGVLFVVLGFVLLVVGAGGAYYAYTRYQNSAAPVEPIVEVAAPIFVDERAEISGTGVALLSALQQGAAQPLGLSKVRLLYASSTLSVFSLLPFDAPNELVRNVQKDGSMAGAVNTGVSQSPFFILLVSSYSTTFAAMLAWEPSMMRSLATLFPPTISSPVVPAAVSTSTATSSSSVGTTTPRVATTTPAKPKQEPGFRDEVISNADVRVYRDEEGKVGLVYGYFSPTTLIIAKDQYAFTEILERLRTTRTR
jgi:hypothetical protein